MVSIFFVRSRKGAMALSANVSWLECWLSILAWIWVKGALWPCLYYPLSAFLTVWLLGFRRVLSPSIKNSSCLASTRQQKAAGGSSPSANIFWACLNKANATPGPIWPQQSRNHNPINLNLNSLTCRIILLSTALLSYRSHDHINDDLVMLTNCWQRQSSEIKN